MVLDFIKMFMFMTNVWRQTLSKAKNHKNDRKPFVLKEKLRFYKNFSDVNVWRQTFYPQVNNKNPYFMGRSA
jgi:hypothetical protein